MVQSKHQFPILLMVYCQDLLIYNFKETLCIPVVLFWAKWSVMMGKISWTTLVKYVYLWCWLTYSDLWQSDFPIFELFFIWHFWFQTTSIFIFICNLDNSNPGKNRLVVFEGILDKSYFSSTETSSCVW